MIQPSNLLSGNIFYRRWVLVICSMIILMIALGGITRLTQSGLSMSSWKFYGNLPPMNEQEWQAEFTRYQATPEYKLVNSQFTAADFKSIYWWEYIHRMTGRSIAVIYVFPLLYFAVARKMNGALILKHIIGFSLIAAQGVLGWIMVKSGLKSKPHVDHYLLAAHFSLALFTLLYHANLLYLRKSTNANQLQPVARFTFAIAGLQLVLGALVAGTKGGLVYNTFPKMGMYWIPPEITGNSLGEILYNGAALQFIHRTVALVLLICVGILISHVYGSTSGKRIRNATQLLALIVTIQIASGISCILFGVPVVLGVLHQLGGVFILLTIHRITRLARLPSDAGNSIEKHAESGTPAANNHKQADLERSHAGLIE